MSIYYSVREGVNGHTDPTQNYPLDFDLVKDRRYFIDVAYCGLGYIRLAIHRDLENEFGVSEIDQSRMALTREDTELLIENLQLSLLGDLR